MRRLIIHVSPDGALWAPLSRHMEAMSAAGFIYTAPQSNGHYHEFADAGAGGIAWDALWHWTSEQNAYHDVLLSVPASAFRSEPRIAREALSTLRSLAGEYEGLTGDADAAAILKAAGYRVEALSEETFEALLASKALAIPPERLRRLHEDCELSHPAAPRRADSMA